ncbi:MAG: heavy metal translocating P-type ATPase [Endomicrobium sp.]|jgi:Cu+-exporting ATPase|nr:heavy metal translocating P-type ATPase [Endomicrobium sp.]
MKEKYLISGMSCAVCAGHVEKSVRNLKPVKAVSVNLVKNEMNVEYDGSQIASCDIIKAVENAGYGAAVSGGGASEQYVDEAMKKRLILSVIFLIPLLYVSMGHMAGLPLPHFLRGINNSLFFAGLQLFFALCISFVNRNYFHKGFKSLLKGFPTMDTLIAIGASASLIYGIYAIIHIWHCLLIGDLELVNAFQTDLYFESAGTILTFITAGKYLESRSKRKTNDAVLKLMELAPKTAFVEIDGVEQKRDLKDVKEGDIIIVKAGSFVPADGIITEGAASIDESAMTGESIARDKSLNDAVSAGTLSRDGYFKMKALKVGDDTLLAKIIQLAQEAGSGKTGMSRLADKVSAFFVPVIITVSAITAILWLISGASAEFALSCAISVLVISCPCALGLATPIAIMAAAGKAAENQILFKNSQVLETLNKATVLILDKTGTLTQSKPSVTALYPCKPATQEELLLTAASSESFSSHPLAEAIMRKARQMNINLKKASDFKILNGGISAIVDGKTVLAGNKKFIESRAIEINLPADFAKQSFEDGDIAVYFALDGTFLGIIFIADIIKESGVAAVKKMQDYGLKTVLLTGDNSATAKSIAAKAGIETVISQVLPDEKEKIVADFQSKGEKVIMAGDGINDAPALIRADVGIALGAGTDIAMESADIVLAKNDLNDIATAYKLSKATIKNIKQNLFWAFFYNIIGIPLAAGVLYPFFAIKLNPMFAAAAMSLSSLFVVTNSLRLRFFKG